MTYNFGSMNLPIQANWRFGMGFFFESLGKGCEGQFVHAYYYVQSNPYNLLDGPTSERSVNFPAIPGKDEVGGPTINYESMREGIDDMRYIGTLKRLIAQARSAGMTAEAGAAEDVLEAVTGSLDCSKFYELAEAWQEFTPTKNIWQRTSPPFDPVKSGKTTETWPDPINFIDGSLRYPNGWTNKDYDDARWSIAQEIIRLQEVPGKRIGR